MQNMTVIIVSVISILLVVSAVTKLISKYSKIPFPILLILVGFLLSYLAKQEQGLVQQLTSYNVYPDILLFVCLPTLIFEAAFTLDARLLRHNLAPVLTLSIPGIFLTTLIIGLIVYLFTPLGFMTALLLGAVLSATDSVAVVAIFRQLGLPKRLAILVEGESLFNSSTAFVLVKTIVFVMLASSFSTRNLLLDSIYHFGLSFFGGIGIGLILSFLAVFLISLLEDERMVVITLTIILAYLSFIVAEYLQVSGVMASITAGVIIADLGRTKISTETESDIHTLLSVFAYIVNSLIFILVGFSVNTTILLNSLWMLAVVIVAMLIARAVMIFGLIPLVCKLPNSQPISLRYQTIMWWGGMQGAIGLTIVLGITNLPNQELLTSLVMGAVLFTIIVQGFSMDKLIHRLKLDKPPLTERFATIEATISAENMTLSRIKTLQSSGLFSLKIAQNLKRACEDSIRYHYAKLKRLKKEKLTPKKEIRLLFLSCFSEEKYFYFDIFNKGHISEQAYRILNHDVDMKIDAMRYRGTISKTLPATFGSYLLMTLVSIVKHLPLLGKMTNWLRVYQSIVDYEVQWGIHEGCMLVLKNLKETAQMKSFEKDTIEHIRAVFLTWYSATTNYLNEVAEQFPEFVNDMQRRFAKRILLHSKYESIMEQVQQGLLPQGVADKMLTNYANQIRELSKEHPEKLKLEPRALLRTVPFFKDISEHELEEVIKLLKEYHAPPGEEVISQGSMGDALFLITRGVVRVIKENEKDTIEVATLMAGDFFGELALLHQIRRTATCKTVTPCILYVLQRDDFITLVQRFPAIQKAIAEEGKKRIDIKKAP